jgi:hypothetical protein
MLTKQRVAWVGVMLGLFSYSSWANDKNFKNAASYTGCASLITRDGIDACKAVQSAKNAACNRSSPCELDKQESWAKDYEVLWNWWDSSAQRDMPDNDFKRDKRRQMTELVANLVAGRAQGNDGVTVANSCIQARNAVQKWFEDVAIPLTERTKNELVSIRKDLVDKFNETKTKREEAKKKYDDNPSDDDLRKEWEAARDANIEAGQKVDEFDKTYGPDITYYYDKLISHYNSEKTNHDTPSREAENRLSKCEKTVRVDWKSLPF